ncbi:Uncharacterised protein [Streptococcus pneumoniae]|nr:Uncharacterised protein [Streptococcus pneumoniae]
MIANNVLEVEVYYSSFNLLYLIVLETLKQIHLLS